MTLTPTPGIGAAGVATRRLPRVHSRRASLGALGALLLLVVPLGAGEYLTYQVAQVLVYAVALLGLVLLIGHTGQISTMVLVPEVVRAVAPVPVLAAGGIVTGAQMAAAMALGAQGVWCGSVWLTTEEAETDPSVKKKMLAASSADTVRSRSLTGKPARMLRSAWTDEWENDKAPAPLPMPLQTMLTASAQQRINRNAGAGGSGATELATYFVGQGVGLMDRVRPARQVVEQMVTDYLAVAENFAAQLQG